jgi:hypothetical protein
LGGAGAQLRKELEPAIGDAKQPQPNLL